ncbi:MAG TPA: T9SS type A sorting domain-containing protein, partial [Bacteroidales bacterium]|nr:T9SS type A sorting domain-containing protein [Bacteroidales bacterium]
ISGTTTTASVNWNNYFGTATVKVRGVNNCGTGSYSASFSVSVTNTTGIESISTETISIYPSPSNGQFTIKSSSLPLAKWSMVNLSGQTVMNGILDLDGMAEVSANDHKGLYIIRIEKDNIRKISKLVIK